MELPLLPTCLVGSYPQPDWLIDRQKLASRFPPRVRARELWRVAQEWLDQAQDDATLLAVRDQERAGLDIITDGEIRRESYSNRFATALEGVDIDKPGTASTAAVIRTPCRASLTRYGAGIPWRSRTCSFCALTPTA
jgi:5-methyltetrahydropteroyltriglutamate--homocysteine methyltransferase